MDKAQLLQPRADTDSGMPEDDVEIPGMGTVRVRGISRKENIDVGKIDDIAERTAHIIALAMISPAMSVSEVKCWSEVALAGELDPVDEKIMELSGLRPDAGKAAYKSNGDRPDAGVRPLPGTEVVDDGGPDEGGAV